MAEKKDAASASAEERRRAVENAEPMERPHEEEQRERQRQRREALNASAPLVAELIPDALDLMHARAEDRARAIESPWPDLNGALGGGFWPGLYVLTGETGAGKSQWALQVALHAARSGAPTLYVNLELGKEDLVARLLALDMAETNGARAPRWSELYLGRNADALRTAGDTNAPRLGELPLRIEVASPFGWAADQLTERVRALRELHPQENGPGSKPVLVVLDYLQAVAPPLDGNRPVRMELRERIALATYQARAAARDYGAAVLLLSSVSRQNSGTIRDAGDVGKDVSPSALVGLGKESGEIEYAADAVLALVRAEQAEGEGSSVRLAIAKSRAGRPSWIELAFNGSWFWSDTRSSRPKEFDV